MCQIPLIMLSYLLTCVSTTLALPDVSPKPAVASATAPASDQPDVVGNRVTFLLTRLASVEESLKVVDASLKTTNLQAKSGERAARGAADSNVKMDLNGGGPVSWDRFYGPTAKDFYLRDTVDRRYSARAGSMRISGNDSTGSRSVARSGARVDSDLHVAVGAHRLERPEIFDRIYAGNEQRRQQAEEDVASLAGKIDQLKDRKRYLEREQIVLWTRLATVTILDRQLNDEPLYKCHLVSESVSGPTGTTDPRAGTGEALGQFLRVAGSASEAVEASVRQDQEAA